MAKLSFTVDDKRVNRMFDNVVKGLNNMRPPLSKAKNFQLKEVDEAYKVAGKNITGQPWKKLSPRYLKQKIRSGFLTPILVRTGEMRKKHKKKKLTNKELVIGNDTKYFKAHQLGRNLPRRQVHGHSKKMIVRVTKIFQDYFIGLAKKR